MLDRVKFYDKANEDGMVNLSDIDDIINEFEDRSCENCKTKTKIKANYSVYNYRCVENEFFVKKDFFCNKWQSC